MDQIKIGKFIKLTRNERNMTQRELADALSISDKTVSKWETGGGLPEVSLMLPLCDVLNISVNELLSGERLDQRQYYIKAEQNIMDLIREKQESKKKIIISVIVAFIAMVAMFALIFVGAYVKMHVALRITLFVAAGVIFALGIGVACVLDRDAGSFECPECGERFVPDMKAYTLGMHTLTKRYLKCPKCGKYHYCKHRLTK